MTPAVTLVESHALAAGEAPDTPSFDARSTALSAGSLAILEQLGLQDAVLENAAGIDTVHVSRRGRLGLARLTAEEQNLPRLGAVVENRWFGHVLLRAVEADPAITLRAPASLTGIRRTSDGYEAMLDDGEELHTPLLIAADGARSRTRDWLGISARHRDIGHDALIANVGLAEPHRGQAFERFLDEGPLAPRRKLSVRWARDEVPTGALVGTSSAGADGAAVVCARAFALPELKSGCATMLVGIHGPQRGPSAP